jgi:CBS domain-containing protein
MHSVVDKDKRLVGALSAAELRGISKDNIRDLLLPVGQFLLARKVRYSLPSLLVPPFMASGQVECEVCTTSMTFRELLLTMQPYGFAPSRCSRPRSDAGVCRLNLHRVFLVDDAGKPEAVITLTDILGQISSLAKSQLTKSQ